MKLTYLIYKKEKLILCVLLFFIIFLIPVSLFSQEQIVKLSGKRLTLKTAFDQIESQSKLLIDFKSHDIDISQIIEKTPESGALKTVLEKILHGTGCIATFSGNHIIITKQEENTEYYNLVGTVTDESGVPLIGVSVIQKGTGKGSITDADGNYKISKIIASDTLTFLFLGLKTKEVAINGRSMINVVMEEDLKMLNEIVVTALGIKKQQKSIGYATQKVEGVTMTKTQEPNIIGNLTGKVAGLTVYNSSDFFSTSSFSLRGEKPLIVIDGIPNKNSDLWELNADDIESIDVLKGTSASALYGSMGRYGAIMVTTKRGGVKDKIEFEVNSSTMYQPSFLRIPAIQSEYGSGRLGQYEYIDGTGNGKEGSGMSWGPKLNQLDPNTPSGYTEIIQYNSPIDPVTGKRIPLPWISRGKDNVDNFFQTGIITSNSINVTFGDQYKNFRVSMANKSQKGIAPNTSLGSTTFGVSGSGKWKDLKVDGSVYYNKQYSDNIPEVAFSSQSYVYNLTMWMSANIDVNDLKDYWEKGKEGYQQRHYITTWYNNPHFLVNEYSYSYYKDVSYGQMSINYDLFPGLQAQLRSGFNYYGLNRETRTPISFVRDFTKTMGNFRTESDSHFSINTDFILSYSKQIRENFGIQARAGASNNYLYHRNSHVATDGLVVPNFYNIKNSLNTLKGGNSFYESKINNVYASIDLEFLHSIYLGINGRNDWVSTLPIKNNSFFYPSISLSYVLSDMIKLPEPLTFVKFRTSWANVSDGDLGSTYAHLNAYNNGTIWHNNSSLSYPGTLISPDLKPETSSSYEVGTDIRLFNNRVGIDFSYFYTLDYNNHEKVAISVVSGFNERLINANEYEKKGVELILRGTPIKTSKLQWDIIANLSQIKRYVKKIDSGGRIGYLKEGDRTDALWRDVWMTNDKGEYIIGSNGHNIQDPYRRMIGYDAPDWVWGVQNSFSYGPFSLFVGIDGRIGGLMESKSIRSMWWAGSHPGTINEHRDKSNAGEASFIADGVIITGGIVEYDVEGNIINDTREYTPNEKAIFYENYISTFHSKAFGNHYYSESFLKLREVNLTYTFPKRILSKTPIKQASISLVGRNLAIISNLKYIDPDSGNDMNIQTPSMRNFGFNLNFKF